MTWSRQSLRIDPIKRSQNGFCQGEPGAVTTSSIPIDSTRLTKVLPKILSRSRSRKRGTEAFAVPPHNRSGLDERECATPIGPESQEGDPEESITVLDPWRFRLALEHHQLVAERSVLEDEIALAPQRRNHKSAQAADHLPHPCSLHLPQ